MIDLRSDTVTVPTDEMRKVMANAPVGDDVYGEDPSINELQEYVADLLGKEKAIFIPSGTMGNQIAVKIHTSPGDEVILEGDSHIFYYETAGPAMIANVQLRCIQSDTGMMDLGLIKESIRPDIYYLPKTSLICLESSHNRHGGTVMPLSYVEKVSQIAKENKLNFHIDGARLWNSCIYLNMSPKEYVKDFDTVNVCLSKGLGAPVGSILAGSTEKIKMALKMRKILGGGMRQGGIIAIAGLYALKNHYKLLEEDNNNAKYFASQINNCEYFTSDVEKVHTNIVVVRFKPQINHVELIEECKKKGLLFAYFDKDMLRFVFHFQISKEQTTQAIEILTDIANKIAKK